MEAYMRVEGRDSLPRGRLSPPPLPPFHHSIKMKAYMRVEGGNTLPRGRASPPPPDLLFAGTRYASLFAVSSRGTFRNFKWPGSSQSLLTLHKNESIHEGRAGGTLPRGRLSPLPPFPPPPSPGKYWLCSQRRDRRKYFQYILEGLSETSNN